MQSVLRLSLWAVAAALFATLSGVCMTVRGESLGHQLSHLLAELDHSVTLDAEMADNRSLREHKLELTDELIAGRLSLAGAADAFYELEVDYHRDFHLVRRAFRGLPEDEAAYCHVFVWVRQRLSRDPAHGPAALARLRAEFEARFHHPLPRQVPD